MSFSRSDVPFGLLLAGALASGGCFQSSSLLIVKGDGSGTIEQRVMFTQAAVSQLRGMAILRGGANVNGDPVTAEQAAAAAEAMGPGVTYVTSTPISNADGQGRDITYAFTDISQLRLAQIPAGMGGVNVRTQSLAAADQVSFNLSRTADGNALLRITVPRSPFSNGGGGPPSGPGQVSLDQLSMFKQMLAGARVTIAVRPVGRLIGTNSAYLDGNRVILMDIDVDALLKDDTTLVRLRDTTSAEEAKAVLKDVPGVKVNFDPEITIEFAPQ